jgi:hypothetical protein
MGFCDFVGGLAARPFCFWAGAAKLAKLAKRRQKLKAVAIRTKRMITHV